MDRSSGPQHLDATAPTGPLADTDSDDLSTLGYEQKLRRSIGGFTSFALAFSMVSINTGIVTLFNDPFDRAGGVAIQLPPEISGQGEDTRVVVWGS
ncbi:hypothetical protein SANTM175S_05635 [Streptomyces antimycoticus]